MKIEPVLSLSTRSRICREIEYCKLWRIRWIQAIKRIWSHCWKCWRRTRRVRRTCSRQMKIHRILAVIIWTEFCLKTREGIKFTVWSNLHPRKCCSYLMHLTILRTLFLLSKGLTFLSNLENLWVINKNNLLLRISRIKVIRNILIDSSKGKSKMNMVNRLPW